MIRKYVKDFNSFILNEQDMGLDLGVGAEAETPKPAKKINFYSFILKELFMILLRTEVITQELKLHLQVQQ